jgi:ubiquinone/menaquinone biosynthesis C-methylase UbiE
VASTIAFATELQIGRLVHRLLRLRGRLRLNAVPKVRYAGCLEHSSELEFDVFWSQVFEKSPALPEEDRHELDLHLVEQSRPQALLRGVGAVQHVRILTRQWRPLTLPRLLRVSRNAVGCGRMPVMEPERDWKALFEQAYAGAPSAVAERVWRQVFGSDFPRGIDPHSYVSASELERMAADVRVGGDEVLVDLGCGRGGAGLWVAAANGARLIGIDIAPNALDAARRRAEAMGLDESRAEFREGSFQRTGLPASSVDAVMSVDALLFSSNKAGALRELRRVIRDRGRLVFTSWDYHHQPVGRPPQVPDHRPHLIAAGFDVLAYEETDDWRRRLSDTTAGLLQHVEELAAESGEDVAKTRAELEEMQATIAAMSRRIFVVAQAR